MNSFLKCALACAAFLPLISCSRGGAEFFDPVKGYGWLSEEYYRSVVDRHEVPRGLADEVLFSFTGTAEAPGIFYIYNFHEGNNWRLSALRPREGGETEAVFANDKDQAYQKSEYFRVVKSDSEGPLLVSRRDMGPAGEFYRYYRRIGWRNFSADIDKNAGVEIAALLLGGEYTAPDGKTVKFLPGGKGDYAGKPFSYSMWTDYVLGPDFQMLTLEGFPGAGRHAGLSVHETREGRFVELHAVKELGAECFEWKRVREPFLKLAAKRGS